MAPLSTTIGALLVGSWFSITAYGIMSYQAYRFLRQAGDRTRYLRVMVCALWCLDTMHVIFACHALYWYLIVHEASPHAVGLIVWSLPTTIAITAAITLVVQIFFAGRIYLLNRNLRIMSVAIVVTALARVGFGCLTTSKAIILGNFAAFQPLVRFYVTTGLTLSVVTDFLVTGSLCIFLSRHRTGFETDTIIDRVIRWTIQTGALTSFFGLVSMICAITMPHNLVWLGVHMIISKLYTTSTIANLNSRELARAERSKDDHSVLQLRDVSHKRRSSEPSSFASSRPYSPASPPRQEMVIRVQQATIVDGGDNSPFGIPLEKRSTDSIC